VRVGKNCITWSVCYVQSGLETLKQCIDCYEGKPRFLNIDSLIHIPKWSFKTGDLLKVVQFK
jgi:hypothetical protein